MMTEIKDVSINLAEEKPEEEDEEKIYGPCKAHFKYYRDNTCYEELDYDASGLAVVK
jgi:hypothetical protein